VTFRDPSGRELFDLPDAPRPDPETPAPPRFLGQYDNVLLSHDDRSRFASVAFAAPGPVHGTVLVDGFVGGTWARNGSTLVVAHTGAATEELEAEGLQLLRFLVPDAADYDVRLTVLAG
jgi:hypothetical protein